MIVGEYTRKKPSNFFIAKVINKDRMQNGRHERMHLTLKKEATKPASDDFPQQQESIDSFIDEYNNERPHQALDMKMPAELYIPSQKEYKG